MDLPAQRDETTPGVYRGALRGAKRNPKRIQSGFGIGCDERTSTGHFWDRFARSTPRYRRPGFYLKNQPAAGTPLLSAAAAALALRYDLAVLIQFAYTLLQAPKESR